MHLDDFFFETSIVLFFWKVVVRVACMHAHIHACWLEPGHVFCHKMFVAGSVFLFLVEPAQYSYLSQNRYLYDITNGPDASSGV